MNEYEIQVLGPDSKPAIDALIRSRSTFVGVPKGEDAWVHRIQTATLGEISDLLDQPVGVVKVFGAWRDAELQGILVTFTSPNQAAWLLRTAYVTPTAGSDVVGCLVDRAATTYESLGFKRFLTVYTTKSYMRYTRLNRSSPIMRRYVGATEYTLPANTRPRFLDYWEYLYGRMLFPEETVVRAFTLVDKSVHTLASVASTDYSYVDKEEQQV